MNIDDNLTSFRTVWLRAVGQAWLDKGFRQDLLAEPIAALRKKFDFEWKWKEVLDLKVQYEPRFLWVGDDWTWPGSAAEEETLTLRLPLGSALAIEPAKRALALADYYRARPSLFGAGGASQSASLAGSLPTTSERSASVTSVSSTAAPVTFAGHHPPRGGFFPSAITFLELQVVLMSAMARAWDNEAFGKLLVGDDPTAALASIRGYSPPWKLRLLVKNDETARWEENSKDGWTGLSKNELRLNLPAAPAPVADQSVALAAYNSTGAEFPFTCCA